MNQLKTVIWGAALILLALIGGTGWLLYERIQDTVAPNAKQKDIDRHETELKQLKQQASDTESRVTILEGDMGNVKKDLDKLGGEVKTLKSDLKAVQEKGEATEASVKDIQAQIVEKEKRIAELERERDKMKQEMQGMQKDIDEIKKALGLKSPN